MDEKLRQLQLTQLEILKIFDGFCRKHDLKYSLYAGSLLGAVRHQGFIPWDDDLDVCMTRADYDRLIALWEISHPEGYILQNKDNSPDFWQSFTKIRKDHTTFLQERREAGKYHTGIFLDVFPLDRIPDDGWARRMFRWYCMIYQLMTRGFVPPRAGWVLRLGAGVILFCVPKGCREKLRQNVLKKIKRYNDRQDLEFAAIETMASLKRTFAPDVADRFIRLPFEDGEFLCFAGWHDHLCRKFGDYMQLPPVEDRAWRHHPIIIDFEHNYEELKHPE